MRGTFKTPVQLMSACALGMAAIVGAGAPRAGAAEVVVTDRPVVVRPAPPIYAERVGPRVYGYVRRAEDWPLRPADCGVYHYWNGEFCADARVTPPDLR